MAQIILPNIVTAGNIIILIIIIGSLKTNIKIVCIALFIIMLGFPRHILHQDLDMLSILFSAFLIMQSRYKDYFNSKFITTGNHTSAIYTMQAIAIFISIKNYIENGTVAYNSNISHNHAVTLMLSLYILSLSPANDNNENLARKLTNKIKYHLMRIINILAILIMLILTGRTGLAVGIGLLIVEIFRGNIYAKVVAFISLVSIFFNGELFLEHLLQFNGGAVKILNQSIVTDIRYDVIFDWFDKMISFQNWMGFGTTYYLDRFGIGPHNSYIQIQSALGLLGLFSFLALIAFNLFRSISLKNYGLSIILLLLLFRMYTDSVANAAIVIFAFMHLHFLLQFNNRGHKWV